MTIGVKTEFTAHKRPENHFRSFVFDIICHSYFEAFIMVCIVLNITIMAMAYEGSKPLYDNTLENINYGFTSVFILESLLKIIALGFKGFWVSGWNRFDLFVVISSIVDILMNALGNSTISFLRVGP